MKVDKINIQNFRNLEQLTISCHPQLNIIYGDNGQGKSNLLEALGCLSIGKSFRVKSDKPLLQKDFPLFYIKAEGDNIKGDLTVEMGYDGSKKKTKVNGLVKNRMVDFIGNLQVVIFSPDDLELVKEGPAERRKFLDTMLCQISHKYCIHLATYQKVLEQRNKVLKEKPKGALSMLQAWDMQIANYAAEIWLLRRKALEQIQEYSSDFFKKVTDSDMELSLTYKNKLEDIEEWNKETLVNTLIQTFQENRDSEFNKGYTRFGPHRDDISIRLDGMDGKIYASQGQQRLIALSMKIGEMKFIEEIAGESPVLLLDDIFSELDKKKIFNLLTTLHEEDRQVFITTTDPFPIDVSHALWYVEKGKYNKTES